MFKLEGQVKDVCMHCIPISNLIKMWFKTRLNHLNMNLCQIGFSQVFLEIQVITFEPFCLL